MLQETQVSEDLKDRRRKIKPSDESIPLLSDHEKTNHIKKFVNGYQNLIWIISRARLPRLLKRVPQPNNIQQVPQESPLSFPADAPPENTSLAPSIQDQPVIASRMGVFPYVDSFFNGVYFTTNKIWPSILLPLLIHDFYQYIQYPNNRHGDQWWKILLGFSENNATISSNLDIPFFEEPFKYWLAIYAIIFSAPILGLLNLAKHYYFDKRYNLLNYDQLRNVLQRSPTNLFITTLDPLWCALHRAKYAILSDSQLDQDTRDEFYDLICDVANSYPTLKPYIFDILADIRDYPRRISNELYDNDILNTEIRTHLDTSLTARINRFYANYKLWSLGQNEDYKYHLPFLLLMIPFLYAAYAKAFFVTLFIKKNIEWNHHVTPQNNTCLADGNIWQFMPEVSEYLCSICGDLPVYINNINNLQGCINGLLAAPRDPKYIASSLMRLARNSNRSQPKTIDLSQQNWVAWNRTDWQQILNLLIPITSNAATLNVSLSSLNSNFINDGKLEDLASFSKKVNLRQIDFSNLGAGSALVNSFLTNSYINQTVYIDFSGNNLNDAELLDVSRNLPPGLTTFIVANNNITDNGFAQAAPFIANLSVNYLDISYNSISQQISAGVATLIKRGLLKILNFAGNDLTGVDLTPFWQATTQNSSLVSIDFSNVDLADDQLASAASYLNSTSMQNFNLANNHFSDIGANGFLIGAQNTTVSNVNLSFNAMTNIGLNAIAKILPKTNIKVLMLNGIQVNYDALVALTTVLPNTTVEYLSLQFTALDDQSISLLASLIKNPRNRLSVLDISFNNRITDVGGQALAQACGNSTLTEIYLNGNTQLTSVTAKAFAENFKYSDLIVFSANNCNIDVSGAVAIAYALADCDLEVLDLGNNPLYDNGTIPLALKLITPTPDPNDLTNPVLNNAEANALSHANAASKLHSLGLSNVGFTDSSGRTICRTLLRTNITNTDFNLLGNPASAVNLQNCRFNNTENLLLDDVDTQNNSSKRGPLSYLPNHSQANRPLENNYSNAQPALLALSSTLLLLSAAVLSLIAIYLIYKKVSPSANRLAAKAYGIFSKQNDPDQKNIKDSTQVIVARTKEPLATCPGKPSP